MANPAQSSRLDTALKLLLITFVSLVAFSTGVYVGKEMSNSDYQLKTMEADFQAQKTAAQKNKDFDVEEKDAIVSDEVAQMSEKMIKSEKDQLGESVVKEEVADGKTEPKAVAKNEAKTEPKKAEKVAVKKPEPVKKDVREVASDEKPIKKVAKATEEPSINLKKSKVNLDEVHKTADRIVKNEVPTTETKAAEKSESRVPSSLPKSVGTASGAGFTVQVASFPTEDEARKQVETLIRKGFPAFPIEATIGGKTWYRVSLGNFKTQKEAATYRIQLIKDSDIKKAIVAKVSPN
jgi:outer membrane biosynthesis protein TonB